MGASSATSELDDVEKKEMFFWDSIEICKIQGQQKFWSHSNLIDPTNAFRDTYQPSRDDVVVLASAMKTGTTWLKALSHCILFRDEAVEDEEDLLTKVNPQFCVPTFEMMSVFPVDHSDHEHRLFHTHLPYSCLPDSIKNHTRGCKLVYITREPKDTLVSQWHFFNKMLFKEDNNKHFPLERAVESFCNGVMHSGPYWDHVLEYWEESKRSPDNVMFIKYEDLHRDPKLYVRKLAAFMGKPFGEDDDDKEVEKVIWRSSFDRLKDLEVNKTAPKQNGEITAPSHHLKYSDFFRRGGVGDWRNYLTVEMAERVDGVTRIKFRGTRLYLEDDKAI